MTAITEPIRDEVSASTSYSKARLTAGLLGRSWLWFLAASFAITMIPILFGWGSYVVVTGSMEPAISAGDVVIVSPGYDANTVAGHVITFEDPTGSDDLLTHRVASVNEDGSLVTRGDANFTIDSAPVPPDAVVGTGRLLVQFVGLPIVWGETRNWAPLALHTALILGAIAAVTLDHEPPVRRRSLRTLISQRQPADPARLWQRAAPTITIALALVVGLASTFGTARGQVSAAAFTSIGTNDANHWSVPNWSYNDSILGLGPYLYWKLDETGAAGTAADSSGNGHTGDYNQDGSSIYFTRLSDGALETDAPDRAVRLIDAGSCVNTGSSSSIGAPQVFTVIAWFRAGSSYDQGGKIVGFERPRTGVLTPTAGAYDRQIYMDGNGRIWFAVYNNGHVTLNSPGTLNDGQWHMAVGTQGSTGMRLYVDGLLVDSNTNTVAETQAGWWRAGCGNLAGWGGNWGGPNNPGTNAGITANRVFAADIDEITVFNSALTAQDVSFLYWAR
ncbi:MAG: signal peptidase I [Acidimicrobiia bacterium]|jgi:signal peptidase I